MKIARNITIAALLATILYTAVAPETLTCFKELSKPKQTDLQCLATNVYHESRGEPWEGQVLVAKVVLNRVNLGFARNACEAVYSPNQFSWTANPAPILNKAAYEIALAAAKAAYLWESPATHFHATYVNPRWNQKLTKLEQIGNHVFYY